MTRYQVFEHYLKPPEKTVENGVSMSFRQMQFIHWIRNNVCSNWMECERRWQRLYPNGTPQEIRARALRSNDAGNT